MKNGPNVACQSWIPGEKCLGKALKAKRRQKNLEKRPKNHTPPPPPQKKWPKVAIHRLKFIEADIQASKHTLRGRKAELIYKRNRDRQVEGEKDWGRVKERTWREGERLS